MAYFKTETAKYNPVSGSVIQQLGVNPYQQLDDNLTKIDAANRLDVQNSIKNAADYEKLQMMKAQEADRVKELKRIENQRTAMQNYSVNPSRVQGGHRDIYDVDVENAFMPTNEDGTGGSAIGQAHAKLLSDDSLSQADLEKRVIELYQPTVDDYSTRFGQLSPLKEDVEAQAYSDLKRLKVDLGAAANAAKLEAAPFKDRATIQAMLDKQYEDAVAIEKNRVAGVKNAIDALYKKDKVKGSSGDGYISNESFHALVDRGNYNDIIDFIGISDTDRGKRDIDLAIAKASKELSPAELKKLKSGLNAALLTNIGNTDIDVASMVDSVKAGKYDDYIKDSSTYNPNRLDQFIKKIEEEDKLGAALTEKEIARPTVNSYLNQKQRDVLKGALGNSDSTSAIPNSAIKGLGGSTGTAGNTNNTITGTVSVKNNNPGNIKISKDTWQGSSGDDGTFVTFKTPQDGVRAMAKDLQTKIKRGDNTLSKIIPQWAPSADKNDPDAYIKSVANMTGIDPTKPLDSSDIFSVVKAMTTVEGTRGSLDTFTDEVIAEGVGKVYPEYRPVPVKDTKTSTKVDLPTTNSTLDNAQNTLYNTYRGDTDRIPQTMSEMIGLPEGVEIADVVPTGMTTGQVPQTFGEMLYGPDNKIDKALKYVKDLAVGDTDMQRSSMNRHALDKRRQDFVKQVNEMPMRQLTALPIESLTELAKSTNLPEETRQKIVQAITFKSRHLN